MMTESVISLTSLMFMAITLIITIVLPIIFFVFLAVKYKGIIPAIIAGVLGFYTSQILIRLPILQFLSTLPAVSEFASNYTEIYVLILGITAALFETAGRIVVFWFLRKNLSYTFGFGAGFGHGAIEAMYLTGLTYLNNLILSAVIYIQGFGGLVAILGDEAIAQSVYDAFSTTQSHLFLMAGFERIFAVVFHIAMSLIICYGFMVKKIIPCALIVFALHSFLDIVASMLSVWGVNFIVIEGVLALIAIACVFIIIKIKKKFPVIEIPKDEAKKAVEQGY